MKLVKHNHRSAKQANAVPRSATFNKKAAGIGTNHTFSAKSKAKK